MTRPQRTPAGRRDVDATQAAGLYVVDVRDGGLATLVQRLADALSQPVVVVGGGAGLESVTAPVPGRASADPGRSADGSHIGAGQVGQTSSIRAIGALSPWRGPSFRIRV